MPMSRCTAPAPNRSARMPEPRAATGKWRGATICGPASENAPAALYFLGRLAEASKDWPSARVYYSEIVREYPNYYYNALARDRLEAAKEIAAAPASNASEFLRTIAFPQ